LKGLFIRAVFVSSDENKLKSEIEFLRQIFVKINKYPKKVVENTLKIVKEKILKERESSALSQGTSTLHQEAEPSSDKEELTHPHIILPYKGVKGECLVKSLKKRLSENLPKNVIPRFIVKGKKLGSHFQVKDKISINHGSGIVYGFNAPTLQRNINHYIGETKVRYETRMYQHAYTDTNSKVYQHSQEEHYIAHPSNFQILAKGYPNWIDRRLCEALFVKDHKPFLNIQKNSHKLELFT